MTEETRKCCRCSYVGGSERFAFGKDLCLQCLATTLGRKPCEVLPTFPPESAAAPLSGDKVGSILQQRGGQYGEAFFNHGKLAKAWQAIIETWLDQKLPRDLPAHIAALMMVQVKVIRAATPFPFHQDNYDDLHGYGRIAELCAKKQAGLNGGVESRT